MERRSLVLFEIPFALLALHAAYPLLSVAHPPLQDLPQHLAAVRILADHGDPALRFDAFYTIELGRTQYLAYYLAVAAFAKVLGVVRANALVLSAAIVGTPYAMRALLRALGRDERAALFVLPLTWNAHLVLGFFNFVAAIPLALVGLALAVRLRTEWTRARAIGLAVVAFVAFYTHVLPFAFLGLGATPILVGESLRDTARRLALLVPAGLAALAWTVSSPAGKATVTAASGTDGAGPSPTFTAVGDAIRNAPGWLTDVLHGPRDDVYLAAFAVLLLLALGLGATDPSPADPITVRARRVLAWLAPLALAGYFLAPESYDWIWPIAPRFPLLALVFLVPSIEVPKRFEGLVLSLGVALVSVLGTNEIARAFGEFDRQEVGRVDEVIGTIPRGSRVVGLIFDRGSREVKFSPFLHYAAYEQAHRGGAAMFSFADFPACPYRFREDNRPPRVPPRWEWTPELVDPRRDLEWYEFALVRGGPGAIGAATDRWQLQMERGPWRVYRRVGARASD